MANGRHFTPEFKAKIAMEILEGLSTTQQIAAREGVGSNLLNAWKREFTANAYRAFSKSKEEKAAESKAREAEEREDMLMAKVGQLTVENDYLKKKCGQAGLGTENRASRGW